jgi:hypothetical protein
MRLPAACPPVGRVGSAGRLRNVESKANNSSAQSVII